MRKIHAKIMTKSASRNRFALYIRNFTFGVEDSLVSTVGLLSGVAAGGVDNKTVFLTGTVLIFVEAFSMGVGSFLSEQSTEEYMERSEVSARQPFVGSVIMFLSYFASGLISLLPYAFLDAFSAFWLSILLSLIALFFLGVVTATAFRLHILRHGFQMLVIGGLAILVGVLVGRFIQAGL